MFVRRFGAAFVLLVTAAHMVAAQPQKTALHVDLVGDAPLPGGVERLLRAAAVPGLTDPAVAIPALIRAVHGLPAKPRTDIPSLFRVVPRLDEVAAAGKSRPAPVASENIPLPLTPDWWSSFVFKRRVAAGELAATILGERRAAFIYLGLMSLDDSTLAHFSAHGSTIAALNDRAVGAFAQWGRSIHIEQGRADVPGGEAAVATWQELVGEPPTDPDRFVRSLLSRDGGRLAAFFDTVSHLDRDRQAFALAAAQGGTRADRVKALYSTVAATSTILTDGDWPVVRHPFGPAALLRQVKVDGEGRMAAPAWRAVWEAAIDVAPTGCAKASGGGAVVDAAWLAQRIEGQFLESRGHWIAAVAFAQRVFPDAASAEMPAACEAIAAFPKNDALLLSLERIGFRQPADYVAILRFTQRTWTGADRRAAVMRTAQLQGIVEVLQRAVSVRALSSLRARELTLSLTKLSLGDGLPNGAVGRWLRSSLLREACPGQASVDACLARLVSGEGWPGSKVAAIEWEDERYRVDLGAASAVVLDRVRRAQKATRIDEALDLLTAASLAAPEHPAAADLERAAAIAKAVAPALTLNGPVLFGHPVSSARQAVEGILPGLAPDATDAVRTTVQTTLLNESDLLLADALVSFAYATAIGDPDDAVLMGGNPARGHLFDSTIGPATEPWHLPEEVQALDRSWLVEGSVLMLRTIYSKSWLRRLSIHDPGAAVRPDPQDVRVFGETVTAFSPFDLTDEGRDQIVAAIRRGRVRIAELAASPPALWKAARGAGLGEWRVRAMLWAARTPRESRPPGTSDPSTYFSLAELMWLGEPEASASVIDAWGVATRTIDGALSVRMPRTSTWEDYQGPRGVGQLATQMADVHLAVAEALADMKLPAALAPGISAQATWDVMAAARMAHRDDWFALVRSAQSIPRDRFLDYVSALTATGPLVPAR
jgi:hypothetical protein